MLMDTDLEKTNVENPTCNLGAISSKQFGFLCWIANRQAVLAMPVYPKDYHVQ
jgi:hypothetical protein